MTNEQLTAYLQDETYLFSVGYEELKTLVMQYPYSANLRILLLKKSFLEQNKDYDRNLQMSATYGTNRKHLYKTIKKLKTFKLAPQNVILGEDYLELTELSNIERLLADRQVNEAVSSTSKLDSLAADWQLEIDDIAFNEEKETGEEEFDLPQLNTHIENKPDKIRTEEDEIDSLINSLVSEYQEPSLDLSQGQFEDTESETLVVHGDEHQLTEDTLVFDKAETKSVAPNTHAEEVKPIELETFMDKHTEKPMLTPDISDASPSVSEHNLLDFSGLDEDEDMEDDRIVDEEMKLMREKELDVPIKNQIADLIKKNNITTSYFEDNESEEDVKKSNIELEIINQTKAPIVETPVSKTVLETKPSFTEWLGQFRMTGPAAVNLAPPPNVKPDIRTEEKIDSQIITPLVTDEAVRKISQKSMVELFETQNEVPDNLFGLATPEHGVHFVDDDDDDDDIFSEYDDTPKKKKLRPMHQLAVKSLVQDEELVSETLADLLAWQGNSVKAIDMYRKLILRFPEKSGYFATKIEKIS